MARHRFFAARRRWMLAAAGALLVVVLAVASAEGFDPDSDFARARATVLAPVAPGPRPIVVDVHPTTIGRPIAPGFVGLSLEYTTIAPYAGHDPRAIDPVLVQLIRGLAPGQRPVLRIGGDTTDWTWWPPVPGLEKPAGIRTGIGRRFGAVLGALARSTDARLILGIDLEADSRRLAALEAERLIHAIGRGSLLALELGNEPELYGTWPWRITPSGVRIVGRAASYGVPAYVRDFGAIASALPAVPLAGPALGGPKWISRVGRFIDAESRVAMVTVHTYPLQECDTPLVAPTHPSVAHLLGLSASQGLASRLAAVAQTTHAEGLRLRVDEMNSVACGGAHVSTTFASALWALDTMFAMARVGVDGVNLHTFQIAKYRLFGLRLRGNHWQGRVAPEYYGLLLFSRAAPPGSRLLRVSGGEGSIRAWATRAPDGVVRSVLINDSATASRVVELRDPGKSGLAAYQALRAPGLGATGGISLGGASFGSLTDTGILAAPRRTLVRPWHGAYVIRLAPASAAMLTLAPRGTELGPGG